MNCNSALIVGENPNIFLGGSAARRHGYARSGIGGQPDLFTLGGPGTVGDFMILKQSPMCWLEDKILT